MARDGWDAAIMMGTMEIHCMQLRRKGREKKSCLVRLEMSYSDSVSIQPERGMESRNRVSFRLVR